MKNKSHFFFIFILFPFFASAQLNLIVGYDAAFKEQKEINYAISRYNNETTNLTNKMAQMWHNSGLDMGLRLNFGQFAVEGHYLTKFRNTSGYTVTNDVKNKQRLKLNDQGFNVAAVSNFKKVGVGLAWESHSFQFSRKFQDDKDYVKAFPNKLRYTALQVFLDFKVPSNEKMGIVIRPYFNFNLQGDDIQESNLNKLLNLSPKHDDFDKTRWQSFGIKLLFLNGRQPDME